jgi:hypothetical protein
VILEEADDDQDGDRDAGTVRTVPPTEACSRPTKTSRFAIAASSRRAEHTPPFLTLRRFRC